MATDSEGTFKKLSEVLGSEQSRDAVTLTLSNIVMALQTGKAVIDPQGRLVFSTEGNYFWAVDPQDPMQSEVYATKDGSLQGPRKINSVLMYKAEDPSKSQAIFVENDYNPETGTVGVIGPLVIETPEGNFVAVQDANRYGIHYKEAFRRGWSRPENEAPEVKSKLDRLQVRRYTEQDLGMTVANNARLVAPEGKKALISNTLTVLTSDSNDLPDVKGASWMSLEEFMTLTEEGMGGGDIGRAVNFGYIKTDPEKLKENIAKIPAHITKLKQS